MTRIEVQGEDELADLPLHDSPGKDLWEGLREPPSGALRARRQGAATDAAFGAAPLSRRVMASALSSERSW